jgi:RNA polymerase sigma-70 factor (ECF subfamily)
VISARRPPRDILGRERAWVNQKSPFLPPFRWSVRIFVDICPPEGYHPGCHIPRGITRAPMDNDVTFAELLRRVRGGDQAAAAELVRRYEPAIRRSVRMKLTDPRLRRAFDSMDVCNSVLANFFVRAAAGQFELDTPEQLLNLLVGMACNKLRDYARREHAARRDCRRVQGDGRQALATVPGRQDSPSAIVAGKELLDRARALLSEEERYLMDQRNLGRGWDDLAAAADTTPDALRMRFIRALDRVAAQLGLDGAAHA